MLTSELAVTVGSAQSTKLPFPPLTSPGSAVSLSAGSKVFRTHDYFVLAIHLAVPI